jgi:hypothetical protein
MGRLVVFVLIGAVTAGCSGSGSAPAAHETPATVDHPRTEAELSTVKLTPEAVKRLGIETVTVKTEAAAATRTWAARSWSLKGEVSS